MFHRVDDIYEMDSVLFFRMAFRLAAYQGVMAARVAKEQEDDEGGQQQQGRSEDAVQRVDSTPAAMAAHGLDGDIEYASV